MREILFRGKTLNTGTWVYGGIFTGTGNSSVIYGVTKDGEIERNVVISDTVGQYTGLKDKNGQRIFEGDIIGSTYDDLNPEDVINEVVVWFSNGWYGKQGDYELDVFDEEGILEFSEIVGNIYDNPELMEEGRNE